MLNLNLYNAKFKKCSSYHSGHHQFWTGSWEGKITTDHLKQTLSIFNEAAFSVLYTSEILGDVRQKLRRSICNLSSQLVPASSLREEDENRVPQLRHQLMQSKTNLYWKSSNPNKGLQQNNHSSRRVCLCFCCCWLFLSFTPTFCFFEHSLSIHICLTPLSLLSFNLSCLPSLMQLLALDPSSTNITFPSFPPS